MAQFLPFTQFFDNSGEPLAGGKIFFYESGAGQVNKTAYTDSSLNNPSQNPAILDGAGRVPQLFIDGVYKVQVTDRNNAVIATLDPIGGDPNSRIAFSDYDPGIIYETNSIVKYDGLFYISAENDNLNNQPDITSSWSRIEFLEDWNSTKTYPADYTVIYDNKRYNSLVENNTGNQPDTSGAQWLNLDAALNIFYDNTTGSGLSADDVQNAIDEIKAIIDALPSSVVYRGTLDISGGDPSLPGSPNNGDLYVIAVSGDITVSVAGAPPALTTVAVGEQIIYNGDDTQWDLIPNTTAAASVNYNNTTSGLTATNVQNAIDELDANADALEASLGTAAFEDITSSATDTTADAVTQTGDGGILTTAGNGIAIDSVDLNNVTTGGLFYITNPTGNSPTGTNGYLIVENSNNSDFIKQTFSLSTGGAVYVRFYESGVWQSWYELFTDNNLTKQTSEYDNTAGRVMTVPAFGIGTDGPTAQVSIDFDNYEDSGFYAVSSISANGPAGESSGQLIVSARTASNTMQLFVGEADNDVYIRHQVGGAW